MFFDFLWIILGLIFGSFFSALSYRFPKNISVAKGRSFCPKCKKRIEWYDNIPVFSYLLLGGKCRQCGNRISLRYPLIETFSAVGFWIIGRSGGNFLEIFYNLSVFSLFLLIFVVDLENQFIPDLFVFLGIAASFLKIFFSGQNVLFASLFAGLLSAFILFSIHLLTKGRGMGLGDVKLAVWGGILTGVKFFWVWLFIAFLTGGVFGIILILLGRAKLKDHIAFGPFLILSLIITHFFGDKVVRLLFF